LAVLGNSPPKPVRRRRANREEIGRYGFAAQRGCTRIIVSAPLPIGPPSYRNEDPAHFRSPPSIARSRCPRCRRQSPEPECDRGHRSPRKAGIRCPGTEIAAVTPGTTSPGSDFGRRQQSGRSCNGEAVCSHRLTPRCTIRANRSTKRHAPSANWLRPERRSARP
jgi:hypothetical protein